MTFEEFADLVREMRAAQKRWFRDRRHGDLSESIRLEKAVDRALAGLADGDKQTTLFRSPFAREH